MKLLKLFIVFTTLFIVLSAFNVYAKEVQIIVNSIELNLSNTKPFYTDETTLYVPLRKIMDVLNATISWDDKSKRVQAKYRNLTIYFGISDNTMEIISPLEKLTIKPAKNFINNNNTLFVDLQTLKNFLDINDTYLKQKSVSIYFFDSFPRQITVNNKIFFITDISKQLNSNDNYTVVSYTKNGMEIIKLNDKYGVREIDNTFTIYESYSDEN